MWNKKSKISKVIWADQDKTLFKIFFEKNDDVAVVSNNSQEWLAEKVRKQFSVDDIDRETNDYHKYTAERTVLFEEFLVDYLDWKEWKERAKFSKTTGSIESLSELLAIAENKTLFFQLKLEIFELEEIKKSTDRALKSKLRKAKTVPELLAHLHQALPDLGSEPSVSDQRIPLQDVTNQQDNSSSDS